MDSGTATKMDFLSELFSCGQNLYYWKLEPSLSLIKTTCPDSQIVGSFFTIGGCREHLLAFIKTGASGPLVMTDFMGMSWIADFEISMDQLCRIHMIGPAFTSDISINQIENDLFHKNFTSDLIHQFTDHIRNLPIMSLTSWLQFGQMLHYAASGEKIEISDFQYQAKDASERYEPADKKAYVPPKSGTWMSEQTAMQMIEDGNLAYQDAFAHLSMSIDGADVQGIKDASRKYKNSVISFVTLATRAAIRGGLDAEMAYLIGNQYIEGVENAKNIPELMRLTTTMYDDFVKRVHKVKLSSGISQTVYACCSYIDIHLADKLTLKEISADVGYAEYYLAQKFKKEMGKTVSQYIKERRIEQAKKLLRSTNQTILEIGESLGFCNTSYFTETFRSVEGCTPGEYRAGNLKEKP